MDILFIPLHHHKTHWALACVDFTAKRILQVDSLSPQPGVDLVRTPSFPFSSERETHLDAAQVLRSWISNLSWQRNKQPFDWQGWRFEIVKVSSPLRARPSAAVPINVLDLVQSAPKQSNKYDCGLFVVRFLPFRRAQSWC